MKEDNKAIINNILNLFSKTNKGDYPLEMEIGLSRTSIQNWRNYNSKPGVDALIKIADYFNVSIDYLVGRESAKQTIQNTNINNQNDNLKQFIQLWEQMDEFQKASVTGYAQGLINKDLTIQKQNKLF